MLKDFVIRAPLPVPLVTTGSSSSFAPAAMTDVPLQVVLVYVQTYLLWKVLRPFFVKTALDNLPGLPTSPSILFRELAVVARE